MANEQVLNLSRNHPMTETTKTVIAEVSYSSFAPYLTRGTAQFRSPMLPAGIELTQSCRQCKVSE